MKDELICRLETFLEDQDFGKNWDGAYQDAVPTLRRYLDAEGYLTLIMHELESESRDTELVATKESMVIRIPWGEDSNGKSVVNLRRIEVRRPKHPEADSQA